MIHDARSRSLLLALPVLSVLALSTLTACSGDEEDPVSEGRSPEEVMELAREKLDETSGVELSLSTDDEPDDGDFLAAADGVITTAPAFEGTVTGRVSGIPASGIDVVSVDGDVWVEVPIRGWGTYDPSDFCAPDPALLLQPDSGVSAVLTSTEDLEVGESERGGEDNDQVLTTYSGTVPGDAIRNILPCSEGDEFEATYRIDSEGHLRSADLTGEFFAGTDGITYHLEVLEYDVDQDISAPE